MLILIYGTYSPIGNDDDSDGSNTFSMSNIDSLYGRMRSAYKVLINDENQNQSLASEDADKKNRQGAEDNVTADVESRERRSSPSRDWRPWRSRL